LSARTRIRLGAAATLIAWTLVGAALALTWLVTGGHHDKVRAMSVLSGSMEPTLHVGDLVVTRVVSPRDLVAGDIVTYRDPARARYVTHRVQSVVWRGELADVLTRGDANEVGEEWTVAADGSVGLVVLRIPGAGYALAALGTTVGQLVLGAIALALAGWAIELIWRKPVPPAALPVHDQAAGQGLRGARSGRPGENLPTTELVGRAR
jgi:signal peptidase I